ncbi:MAG: iron uptake porin, partial [Cyanobacteriota bacterium]|nr:iron uptake porin [Cyanobacteriota bacterium]
LSNLIERYGCVAGYPSGSYLGNRAMTRFEAAALLNACLDRITEVTDELRRLLNEFEQELAILKGRVDGLEARVGELEATQFSTTTKLVGQASFVIGANSFAGSLDDVRDIYNKEWGATSFNYDLELVLNTSFTGKDSLSTTLRAGNFGKTVFGGDGPTNLSTLEVASESETGADLVYIDKIFYQFPIGENFTATLGAIVGQEDMLAIWPTAYASDGSSTVLDVVTLPGASAGAFNKNLGQGAGIWWENNGWAISVNYVAANGRNGDPNSNDDLCGGIANDCSAGTGTAQIGYIDEQWGVAATYSYLQNNDLVLYSSMDVADSYGFTSETDSYTNAFALSAYWMPQENGWIPSVSLGWGINSTSFEDDHDVYKGEVSQSQSWMVGLEWNDLFVEGNAGGFAIGQAPFATRLKGGGTPHDGNYVSELWYKFQATDNIVVTPGLFYLSRPASGLMDTDETLNQFGGVLRTTFSF